MKTEKTHRVIVLLLFSIFVISCNNMNDRMPDHKNFVKETFNVSMKKKSDELKLKRHYNRMVLPYLVLTEDSLYHLNLDSSSALRIGIPLNILSDIKKEISETNEIILKSRKEKKNIETPNPQSEQYLDRIEEPVVFDEQLYYTNPDPRPTTLSGRLSAYGQEEVTSGLVWAPININSVKFNCQAAAAIVPAFYCKTKSSGLWQEKMGVGIMGVAEIIVPLYVSNDYINLSFRTTDSNGGYAVYTGIKK